MTRILVPTDFSEASLAAVRSGIELAMAAEGVVLLLHVVEGASVRCYAIGGPPHFLSDMIDLGGDSFRSAFDQKLLRRDNCEEARWKLDTLIPPSCQAHVQTMVTVGPAVDEIVRVAKAEHSDLILLGARGRRGWRHVFKRTMADRVRGKALIPVITLDAHDLRGGRDSGRRSVLEPRLRTSRAVSHEIELVGVVQHLDASHSPPSVEPTWRPRENAHDGPEPFAPPHSASRDERGMVV